MSINDDLNYHLHKGDLPDNLNLEGDIAADCEMMGLHPIRDRLCLVQLKSRQSDIHLVQIMQGQTDAPNLKALFESAESDKIFHFARADLATLKQWLNIKITTPFCTRTASRLVRTYTNKHGLRAVCREFFDVDLNKQSRLTDWGTEDLSQEQLLYAAADVLYLHRIKDIMIERL